ADTTLDTRGGSSSAGSAATIVADLGSGWHKDAFLRFEVPASLGAVTKAVLKLRVVNGSAAGGVIQASRLMNGRSEGGAARSSEPRRTAMSRRRTRPWSRAQKRRCSPMTTTA